MEWGLDAGHQALRLVQSLLLGHEVPDRGALDHLAHRLLNPLAHARDGRVRAAVAAKWRTAGGPGRGGICGQRGALESANDVADGDQIRRLSQGVASRRPPGAPDQSGAAEGREKLIE